MSKIKKLVIFPIVGMLIAGCGLKTKGIELFNKNNVNLIKEDIDTTDNLNIINGDIKYDDLDKLLKVDYVDSDDAKRSMLCIKTYKTVYDGNKKLVYADYYDVNNDLDLVYEYYHDESTDSFVYTLNNGIKIYRENSMKNIVDRSDVINDSYTLDEVVDRFNNSISEDNKKSYR